MKKEYRRELNHNYMVLIGGTKDCIDYQCRMITDNHPDHFLHAFFRRQDSEIRMYYDITSLQPLARVYGQKSLSKGQIVALIQHLAEACKEAEEFLLDVDRICLAPEDIYVDIQQEAYYFCLGFPKTTTLEEDIRELLRFVLDHISHQNFASVGLAYGLYQTSEKEGVTWRELLSFCVKEQENPLPAAKELPCQNQSPSFKDSSRVLPDEAQVLQEETVKSEASSLSARLQKSVKQYEWNGYAAAGIVLLTALVAYYLNFMVSVTPSMRFKVISLVFLVGMLLGQAMSKAWKFFQNKKGMFGGHSIAPFHEKKTDTTEVPETDRLYAEEVLEEEITALPIAQVFVTQKLFETMERKKEYRLCSRFPEQYPDILISKFPFVIGKLSDETDYSPKSVLISRLHAQIEQEEERLYLMDLNSTNGTMINGRYLQPSEKAEIIPGDEITLADQRYYLEVSGHNHYRVNFEKRDR